MTNPKLHPRRRRSHRLVLGTEEDFTEQEVDWLSDLITEKLNNEGVSTKGFSFQIRVEYIPERK